MYKRLEMFYERAQRGFLWKKVRKHCEASVHKKSTKFKNGYEHTAYKIQMRCTDRRRGK